MTELQQRWLTALRSAKYIQGRNKLCTVDAEGKKFCCLGVAADVLGVEWVGDVVLEYAIDYPETYDDESEFSKFWLDSELPPEHLRLYGIDEAIQGILVRANDGGASFAEIADALEAYFTNKDVLLLDNLQTTYGSNIMVETT